MVDPVERRKGLTTTTTTTNTNITGTLLGFTTLMQYNNSESSNAFEDVYESYLVEVQSQRPMLFNFNTPRLHYQRTQFLYVARCPRVGASAGRCLYTRIDLRRVLSTRLLCSFAPS